MSKKQETKPSSQGQSGEKIKLDLADMTTNERKLLDVLARPGRPVLTIKELVDECKWKSIKGGKARGNSRVRNTLRRLIRGKWVTHPEDIGDGRYRLAPGKIRHFQPKPAKRAKPKTQEPANEEQAAS